MKLSSKGAFYPIGTKNRKGEWVQLRKEGVYRFIDLLSKKSGKTKVIDSRQIN